VALAYVDMAARSKVVVRTQKSDEVREQESVRGTVWKNAECCYTTSL